MEEFNLCKCFTHHTRKERERKGERDERASAKKRCDMSDSVNKLRSNAAVSLLISQFIWFYFFPFGSSAVAFRQRYKLKRDQHTN